MIAGIGRRVSIVAYDIINLLQKIKYCDNVLAKLNWLLLEDNDIRQHFQKFLVSGYCLQQLGTKKLLQQSRYLYVK